jgi:hypothetical protein
MKVFYHTNDCSMTLKKSQRFAYWIFIANHFQSGFINNKSIAIGWKTL